MSAAWSAAKSLAGFVGYDAVTSKGKRKAPDGILRSEDAELNRTERRKLISSARELNRNFSIAAWAIRKHLDYVTTFNFQPKGKHADWLAKFMGQWSKARNFDITGRHPMRRFFRIAEARKILDGDCFLNKLNTGHVQAIEGDRICTPYGGPPPGVPYEQILHGVQVDDVGRAVAYCVCKRGRITDWGQTGTDFTFERMIPAEHMLQHAHFDRFDQVRGISPMASALNNLRDVYEGLDYILMRMKLQQLFGLVLYRGDPTAIQPEMYDQRVEEGLTQDYAHTVRLNGTKILDLDVGDKAEFLESKTPAAETQAFLQQMIAIALKAIDIPYSFYAENFSNYSGSRQALLQYEQSAANARSDNKELRDDLTLWRLQLAELRDELPPGATADDMEWDWIPTGLPWIDPMKEVSAQIAALNAGLTSRTRICRENGQDFYQIADERKEEDDYLAQLQLVTNTEQDPALMRALLQQQEGAREDG